MYAWATVLGVAWSEPTAPTGVSKLRNAAAGQLGFGCVMICDYLYVTVVMLSYIDPVFFEAVSLRQEKDDFQTWSANQAWNAAAALAESAARDLQAAEQAKRTALNAARAARRTLAEVNKLKKDTVTNLQMWHVQTCGFVMCDISIYI